MRRLLSVLLLLTLLALILPVGASAWTISFLYVWDADLPVTEGVLPLGAIQWSSVGNRYYLFLPSGLDASNLRVYFISSATEFTAGGASVPNGGVTDVFVPGTTVTLTSGKDSYDVTVLQSAAVASVFITTRSRSIEWISLNKNNAESGSLFVMDAEGNTDYRNDFEYIRVRGNYSFYPDKKSFHIRLNDGAPLLGMESAKTWLLLANYCDLSLLRNAVTFDLADAAGMPFTTDYRFADVYVNAVYCGSYLLSEKIQVNKRRVAITDLEKATESLNAYPLFAFPMMGSATYDYGASRYFWIPEEPEDVTGGYLLQLEMENRYTETASGFVTARGQSVLVKSPEYVTEAQMRYISALVRSFESAVFAEDGVDPATGRHYTEIADMDSLVGKYIVEELSKNLDGNRSSFYLFKDSDAVSDKLYFGPVWDYDIAYGNYSESYYDDALTDPKGLLTAKDNYRYYYWFPALWKHADFRQAVAEAWENKYRPLVDVLLGRRAPDENTGALQSLDDYAALLSASAAMNFTRWRIFNAEEFPVETGEDYAANIEYLRAFLTERADYLDAVWLEGVDEKEGTYGWPYDD
ncbi:MAG: CotH kinase family protein [Clostridia bacterium]|nr:CotH kinase family protein [Clostridia bacterium]